MLSVVVYSGPSIGLHVKLYHYQAKINFYDRYSGVSGLRAF